MRDPFPEASHVVLIVLILAMAIPLPAQAAAPRTRPVSDIIPLLGLFSALRARNRVYREANSFIQDQDQYYDRLRDTAREQLRNREIATLRTSQVAAFTKVVGLIEGERTAMSDFAESEKKAARSEFLDKVGSEITKRLIGTGLAQDVFGAMSSGVSSSKGLLQGALDKISGGAGGVLGEAQRIRSIAIRIRRVSSIVGGKPGEAISTIASRIVRTIDRPTEEIKAGLETTLSDLSELEALIEEQRNRGRAPNSSQTTRDVAINLVTGEEDPVITAILDLFTRRDQPSIRERARQELIAGIVARCSTFGERFRREFAALQRNLGNEDVPPDQGLCAALDILGIVEQVEAGLAERGQSPEVGEVEGAVASTNAISIINTIVERGECVIYIPSGTAVTPNPDTQLCDYDITFNLEYETLNPAQIQCFVVDFADTTQVVPGPVGTANVTVHAEDEYILVGQTLEHAAFCQLQDQSSGEWLAEASVGSHTYDAALLIPGP